MPVGSSRTPRPVLRKHVIYASGYIRDSVYFSILDTEWPQVRAKLEARLARTDTSE